MDIRFLLSRLGEVAQLSTLRRAGLSDAEIRELVRARHLIRLRRGWYCSSAADRDQRRAVTVHGVVGCSSALARLGVWSGVDRALHIHVPRNAARLGTAVGPLEGSDIPVFHPLTPDRLRRGIRPSAPASAPRVHWAEERDRAAALDWIVSPSTALAEASRCLDPLHAQAAVDSMIGERVMTAASVRRVLASLPSTHGLVVDELSGRIESGAESIFVRRLQAAGYQVEPQFRLPGHGRYDGLIEGCVLFDIDGWAFHSEREQFAADRDRTLVAQAFGMPLIRATATQVLDDWPTVRAAVDRVVGDARMLRGVRRLPAAG
ncbi:hypothetical protein ET445_16955 [Agromyces protaetiae]|uniref:DUF559 domain-containing protein n=1 Tax=Agromyces protaetiae TaxID=2509455 RepID=A0A4P6FF53_9MICO|nr:type IV toxin-antitoxin system AbiEi family antitoxin domain-containing protein [Agromyces protaetiae]QAY74772.1 hypothetical protein ET445_16955 [Agromyces protaetiae]